MMNWSKWLYLDIDMVTETWMFRPLCCPARKYICPARLRGNTPASGEIYFRAGQQMCDLLPRHFERVHHHA
jgi:hypothetical protein